MYKLVVIREQKPKTKIKRFYSLQKLIMEKQIKTEVINTLYKKLETMEKLSYEENVSWKLHDKIIEAMNLVATEFEDPQKTYNLILINGKHIPITLEIGDYDLVIWNATLSGTKKEQRRHFEWFLMALANQNLIANLPFNWYYPKLEASILAYIGRKD